MKSKLEIRLLSYFLLIVFAVVLIAIEFYFELDFEYGLQLCKQALNVDGEQASTPTLKQLRNKILIMFMILSIVVAIVLVMFLRIIANPLSKMATVAKCINEGDLSQTVIIEHQDEIGEVGIAINDLASNLQEVATFTASTANESLETLKQLRILANDDEELIQHINAIEQNLLSMSSFVNSFTLLDTDLPNA